MSCCPSCGQTIVVNTPGVAGQNGAAGAAGASGVNAFTITTSNFTIPAAASNVTVLVANSTWMAVSQELFVSDGTNVGHYQVVSFPNNASVVLKFLNESGDTGSGGTISLGATVSPSGIPGSTPANTFANGMTTGTTKATAQTNLGLGQNALISTSAGLTQAITNSAVEVGTCDIQVATVGEYLLMANAAISMNGCTFASSRTITLKIRNITQGVDICSAAYTTEVLTTTSIPTFAIEVPFKSDATAVANDHYQLMISIDVVPSAGTLSVTGGSLCAIPLRFS